MPGLYQNGNNYRAERSYLGLGIQARKQKSIEQAEASLKAIDRVVATMQSEINVRLMEGKSFTFDDCQQFIKAAIAAERTSSSEVSVDKWRCSAKANLATGFTPASLKELCKDPKIRRAPREIRVKTGTLEEVLPIWLKLIKTTLQCAACKTFFPRSHWSRNQKKHASRGDRMVCKECQAKGNLLCCFLCLMTLGLIVMLALGFVSAESSNNFISSCINKGLDCFPSFPARFY